MGAPPEPHPQPGAPRGGLALTLTLTRTPAQVRLVEAAFECACACGADGARLLYARARDLVDLFLCVGPTGAPRGVLIPHTHLLRHNDALLLRHRCLTIGYEYARRLPSPLGHDDSGSGGLASLVDLAPSLAELASTAL